MSFCRRVYCAKIKIQAAQLLVKLYCWRQKGRLNLHITNLPSPQLPDEGNHLDQQRSGCFDRGAHFCFRNRSVICREELPVIQASRTTCVAVPLLRAFEPITPQARSKMNHSSRCERKLISETPPQLPETSMAVRRGGRLHMELHHG